MTQILIAEYVTAPCRNHQTRLRKRPQNFKWPNKSVILRQRERGMAGRSESIQTHSHPLSSSHGGEGTCRSKYEETNSDKDPVKLPTSIQNITHKYDNTKQGMIPLVDHDFKLFTHCQLAKESTVTSIERLMQQSKLRRHGRIPGYHKKHTTYITMLKRLLGVGVTPTLINDLNKKVLLYYVIITLPICSSST